MFVSWLIGVGGVELVVVKAAAPVPSPPPLDTRAFVLGWRIAGEGCLYASPSGKGRSLERTQDCAHRSHRWDAARICPARPRMALRSSQKLAIGERIVGALLLTIIRPGHGEREGLAHLVDFTRPHHTHREASECYGASTPARRSALSPCTLAAQLHAAADSWLGRTATFGAASSWCRQENLSPCMLEGFSVDAVLVVKLVLFSSLLVSETHERGPG